MRSPVTRMLGWACLLLAAAGAHAASESDDRGLGCRDAVTEIDRGFGSPGAHPVIAQELAHPSWPGRSVTLHRPGGVEGAVPVVFFAHGFGATHPVHYRGLVEHLVSRGVAVVYAPYKSVASTHGERYAMLWAGFEAAAREGEPWLDLTRVGFVGHSFGGGATPSLARRGLVERSWGGNGAFVMVMAPWYVLDTESGDLASLPEHTRVLVQVYEDEVVNDHRIAIDLFHSLGNHYLKSFMMVRSDRQGLCRLKAGHTTPATDSVRGRTDGLDRHGVFRVLDALTAEAFMDDAEARALLFTDEARTLEMGAWGDGTPVTPAELDPHPEPARDPKGYYFTRDAKARWMRATELQF